MMTIKQLADELGVTKTAIRKRFTDDFREKYIHTTDNNTLIIDDEGCKLIAETLQTTTNQIPKTTENQVETVAKTPENSANSLLETLQTTISVLKEQLSEKDNQIAALTSALVTSQEQANQLIKSLHDNATALTAAQALHAGTIQERLTEHSETSDEDIIASGEFEGAATQNDKKPSLKQRFKYLFLGE